MISQSKISKKTLIFQAALDLFANQDVDKTSTASVAKHAGVSNGTLFHYFPKKNDLIIELYLLLKTEMFDFIYRGNIKETGSIKGMIHSGFMNAINWIVNNKLKHSYIHKIYKSSYKSLIIDEELPENYKHYLKILKTGIENKILKDIPTDLMANIINNHISALADYYLNNKLKTSDSLNNKVFNMTWDSIKF